jgi:lysozyme
MKISTEGIELIKQFENFSPTWYKDSKGVWTIGYGHAGKGSERYTINRVNRNEALKILQNDISIAEAAVNKLVKVELTQNQYDALVSFVFNVGEGNFSKSTLLKKLNEKKYDEAAEEFLKWNKITYQGKKIELLGLTNRRNKEKALFLAHKKEKQ